MNSIIAQIMTVLILVLFIGIVLWAYSDDRIDQFNDAKNIIFQDDKKEEEEQ